jgi:hypothetical protein
VLANLLKWQFQPERRGAGRETTLRLQRRVIERRLNKMPSLRPMLVDADWVSDMWGDACQQAAAEMEIGVVLLPESCPWSMTQALDDRFLPN